MQRKDFIRLSGGTTAFVLFGGISWLFQSCSKSGMKSMGSISVMEGDFDYLLPIPQTLLGTNVISLNAKSNTASIIKGKKSRVLGYSGGILGSIIKVQNGQSVNIDFINGLEEETNIHWHGLIIPADMDGHPEKIIQPGSSFNYNFTVNQRAGTYWFHPHTHMKTAKQVFKGLAGIFIVSDSEETTLNLPSGEFEIPLVIQDKRIYSDGSLNYSPTTDDVMSGYFGDYICVNGAWSSYHEVKTRIHRLRIVNGSTARVYNLSFSNNANFYLIGSDAGLIATSQSINSLIIAPGERADILIDFSSVPIGSEVFLQSNTFNGGDSQGTAAFKIMKFKIVTQEAENFTIPSSLSAITSLSPASAIRSRSFDIANSHGGMNMENMGSMGNVHNIGGKSFDINRIDETVKAGDTEIWEFDNTNGMDIHPMHIHGLHFQVLSRTGGRNSVQPHETGWKDTVLLMPGEKVRVIMTFPNNLGKFVFHCHNLEHEDSGMMLNFKII